MSKRHHIWLHNVALKLAEPEVMYALAFIRNGIKELPGFNEGLSYGTPAFFVGKKLFARLKEDCETLVVQTYEREKWMEADPATFFVTDHYLNYDYMLVSLKTVSPEVLTKLLTIAWSNRATNKFIKEYEEQGNTRPI